MKYKAFGNPTLFFASFVSPEQLYKWVLTVTRVTSPPRTKLDYLF